MSLARLYISLMGWHHQNKNSAILKDHLNEQFIDKKHLGVKAHAQNELL